MTVEPPVCRSCKEPLNIGAIKCKSCGDYQSWARSLLAGGTGVAIVSAVISSASAAVALWITFWPEPGVSPEIVFLSTDQDGLNFAVRNSGTQSTFLANIRLRSRVLKEGFVEIENPMWESGGDLTFVTIALSVNPKSYDGEVASNQVKTFTIKNSDIVASNWKKVDSIVGPEDPRLKGKRLNSFLARVLSKKHRLKRMIEGHNLRTRTDDKGEWTEFIPTGTAVAFRGKTGGWSSTRGPSGTCVAEVDFYSGDVKSPKKILWPIECEQLVDLYMSVKPKDDSTPSQ